MQITLEQFSTYLECPRKYQLSYTEEGTDVTPQRVYERSIMTGVLAHELLEAMLQGEDYWDTFAVLLPVWLSETCGVYGSTDQQQMRSGDAVYYQTLMEYSDAVSDLLLRCAPNYRNADVIRNSDRKRSIPVDPLTFPPKQLQQEMARYQSDRMAIDIAAANLNPVFERLSLANITAQALFYAKNFEYPEWFERTLAVNYPLAAKSNQPAPVALRNGVTWQGSIDWIVKDCEGKVALIEHRLGNRAPEPLDIIWNYELNLYAAIYSEHKNQIVDYIGISYLPGAQVILVEPDPVAMGETLQLFRSLHDAIDQEVFPKRFPNATRSKVNRTASSPCVTLDVRSGQVQTICPYLYSCHSHYYRDLVDAHGLKLHTI